MEDAKRLGFGGRRLAGQPQERLAGFVEDFAEA
jgi:hypothetical protein